MTTRNQRRNRQLAIARARVRALEAQVAVLQERLREHVDEHYTLILHSGPAAGFLEEQEKRVGHG